MGRAMLFLVFGMVFILGIDQTSMSSRQLLMSNRSSNYASKTQSRNIAASMISLAIHDINDDIGWHSGLENDNILGGSGTVTVKTPSEDASLNEYETRFIAKGFYNDVTSTIDVTLQRTAFSRFAYFTNQEPEIYFVSQDTINGPAHTNGIFHMWGEPVFKKEITSPNKWVGQATPKFEGGYNFDSNPITLPQNLEEIKSNAISGGLRFNNDIKIDLQADGTVQISELQRTFSWYRGWVNTWGDPQTYNLSNYNGVISTRGNMDVQGTLKGRLTLHSEKDVHITGDLTYADNPDSNPDSNDMLGIVSEDDVVIDDGAQTKHGDQDLTIDASIMALGQMRVNDYYSGQSRGILHIYGGVIQGKRGPVGTFIKTGGGTRLNSGYSKQYDYDQRLLKKWPPFFPLQDNFQIIAWKEY